MTARKKSWFYLVAVFLLGFIAGGVLTAALVKHRLSQPLKLASIGPQVEREITKKLDLDAEQQAKLRPLVTSTMKRINGIYFDTLQQIDAAILDAQTVFVAGLRPEQKEKLKTLATDRQDFIRKHNPLPPPDAPEKKSPPAP